MTSDCVFLQKEDLKKDITKEEMYWEWLCSIPGIYRAQQEVLLKCFKTAEGIWNASEEELNHMMTRGRNWIEKIKNFRQQFAPEQIRCVHREKEIQFISCENPGYPHRLHTIQNKPHGLFVKGQLPDSEQKSIGIVGARSCTREGKCMAERLAEETVHGGGCVISGGAYGIDGAAQWTALECGGKSWAVLGCGVDYVYPRLHDRLFERLTESGGIVSEFPPGTPPLAKHFPMRNRIISGLSDIVVVVEARKRSGSLITAEFAAEQGRTVMAVPGRPGDHLSEGCNELIAQGAGVILSPKSFSEIIFPEQRKTGREFSEKFTLAPVEKLVYSSLGLHAKSVWELEEGTALSLAELSRALLSLEMQGLIKEQDRNHYIRVK